MQIFASKCLRDIVIGKTSNESEETRITNYEIRRNNNIPTICSQLQRENYVIYRWKTSLSPAYLNNKDECDGMISIWEIMWTRMQNIMRKIKDKEQLDDREIGIYKTFKKLIKMENANTSVII